ncbi:MotE family protein [Thalassococcus lentus]|uniref:Magnesium transporter MgtE intracellular domain-containing protein n=1 Tax=Thalassococcus lentus TaxID=1210524 RepID=A0ABT4XMU3_9RHOB|nr:hypothetical protein [Thalassococcus lentus]MDA7423266.1 hypothetical protein [Thalassococcus lentus]
MEKPKKQRRSKTFGALSVIGSLLLASAVLRITIGATSAIAREEPLKAPPDVQQVAAEPAATSLLSDEDIAPVLAALKARETRIAKREEAVAVRQKALEIAKSEIDQRMAALAAAEESLKATLSLAQTAAEDDIKKLTDVYATMKPKKAAALFEEMDPEFAAGFLGRMRPDAAAAILAGLNPQAAYTISVILAGRNANAPKN